MRILGFSVMWAKLLSAEFTTFRFTRRDKDWIVGEQVQIVYRPRSKGRKVLGIAEIIAKETRRIDRFRGTPTSSIHGFLTENEAKEDGFQNAKDMLDWLEETYQQDGRWQSGIPLNRLTLQWLDQYKGGKYVLCIMR